jgi:PDZ domain-containing protein
MITVGEGLANHSDGEVFFTTVSLRQATLLQALAGWIDPDIDVVPRERILGDRDADENRQFNQLLMDTSQQVATQVALEQLGYEVPITITGELVVEVEPGTAAEGVLTPGDTIVAVDGTRLTAPGKLTELMADRRPGDRARFTVSPADRSAEREVELELGEHPDDPARGFIGVQLQPRDLEFEFPLDVAIDADQVGGPSAGLAFTLGILDVLTPGELTGGRPVAVTGTIDSAGQVGRVGGVGQKAAAVREAGIRLFLVPSAEVELARRRAGSDVEVVGVDTLEDALAALDRLGGNALDLGRPGAGPAESAQGS